MQRQPPGAAPLPASGGDDGEGGDGDADANQLSWLPPTAASLGLRLAMLDASLVYRDGDRPWRDTSEVLAVLQRISPSSPSQPFRRGLGT